MVTIPVKVLERFKANLNKIQKVTEQAKSRDINESDTVVIVSDVLALMFGYDKYTEITSEYAIKSTYCDLAIKVDNILKFLIEVKAIGITLAEKHCQQALDYGANNGTEWIILTNSINWKVYKVCFEKPIKTDLVCEFNLLDIKLKSKGDLDKLFILCKEGLKRNAIDEFTQHRMIVNKYYIGTILRSESVTEAIKREFRKIDPLIKIEDEEINSLIVNDVLKRELLDTPEAIDACDKYNKIIKKIEKKKSKSKEIEKSTIDEKKENDTKNISNEDSK
ncbi:MAG: type I restriction enzyme HsdR N-terminal domain-containing protein [Bacteroidales bacterium]|jgi:predicted type IV restriction endonuclease